MIVVYGVRRKVKLIKSLGVSTCSNCGHETEHSLSKEGGYCHVYYIPVFPYVGGFKFISCPNCGIERLVSKEEFKELKEKN